MGQIRRKLESGTRWWAAEVVLRSTGLLLTTIAAAGVRKLDQSMIATGREVSFVQFMVALIVVVLGAVGLALMLEGPGLFRLVPIPARSWIAWRQP